MSDQAESYNPTLRPPGTQGAPAPAQVDVLERGAEKNGQPQVMDRRLFMQLLVLRAPVGHDPAPYGRELAEAAEASKSSAVVYEDVNDPRSFGLLTWSEAPGHFVSRVRPLFGRDRLRDMELRPELTMLGRTYSQGYEQDLPFWLLQRPQETVLNEDWPWAVWYPLRRSGAFEQLEPKDRGSILREHAVIGRSYGSKDLAHDVRLACHGLDANDNEFIIGLVGKELHPLSHVVQTMRKTRQTSQYIQQMGPFFVGHVRWRVGQAPAPAEAGGE
ncbi:MAG: chlorite dismutase family protein [Myxococcota bacterium]